MNSQNIGNSSPYVTRATRARDMLVAAGMGDQVRVITFDASKFAGSDDVAYMRYVQQKIDEYEAAKDNLARLLRYFDKLKPFEQKIIADMVQDIAEMTEEGQEHVQAMRYIRRNYT